jgi:hypothetical protein
VFCKVQTAVLVFYLKTLQVSKGLDPFTDMAHDSSKQHKCETNTRILLKTLVSFTLFIRTCPLSGKLFRIWRCWIQISARRPSKLIEVLCGFPQVLHEIQWDMLQRTNATTNSFCH